MPISFTYRCFCFVQKCSAKFNHLWIHYIACFKWHGSTTTITTRTFAIESFICFPFQVWNTFTAEVKWHVWPHTHTHILFNVLLHNYEKKKIIIAWESTFKKKDAIWSTGISFYYKSRILSNLLLPYVIFAEISSHKTFRSNFSQLALKLLIPFLCQL